MRTWVGSGVLAAGWAVQGAEPVSSAAGVEFFEQHVRPVLIDHCYSCHSLDAEKLKGDLLLDSLAGWQKGGASGRPALVRGDAEASLLLQAVRHTDPDLAMPPRKKLAAEQIAALETWIRLGAPDPRTNAAALPDPQSLARQHWAFQPVRKPSPPSVTNTAWVRNPVDRFILAGIERAGFAPSPAAGRRALARRASFVLTGLPPTAAEVEQFERDTSPEAFERVVDRLLASPRYGERWARYWLDIARYADTKGYVFEEERRYPYAYTYRDWVVRAFNDDLPYDQFLVAQIAGDRVATPEDRSPLAAMGFLTLGRRFLNNPHDIIDDRVDVLTRGTMALTVTCARCHDHKYDPIPAADYYSLYGVFASSHEPAEKPLLGTIPDPVRNAQFQTELARRERERDDFVRGKEEEHRRKLRQTVGDHLLAAFTTAQAGEARREEIARSRQLSPKVVGRWVAALEGWQKSPDPLFAAWLEFAAIPTNTFAALAGEVAVRVAANAGGLHAVPVALAFTGPPPSSLEEVAQRYSRVFTDPTDAGLKAFLTATGTPIDLPASELHALFNVPEAQRKRALQRAVEELHATHPGAPPRAMSLADNEKPTEPEVFKRGNPGTPGPKVPRQFLAVLSGADRQPFTQGSGRLELARAIASPDNPLTARVIVNRVWLQMFGSGLVRTPADFGLRSEPPSHPELLDWLAATLVEQHWSLKELQRLILRSATWQQSGDVPEELAERDPDNRLYARQNRRRLDFEATRDLLLAAGDRLDLAMGGHSVEITTRDYAPRRTVYGYVERQNLPGVFRTFDFASPDTTSAQRFQTTVPQQALYFLNSPFALDQARRLARRPDVLALPDLASRVARLHEITLQRSPEAYELELAARFLAGSDPGEQAATSVPLWQQGYGHFDAAEQQVRRFSVLPHFTGTAWQGGPALPDPELGWIHWTADGGHPGGLRQGPAIRRWTAPGDGVVDVAGALHHPGEAGDGVVAFLVSSRHGTVGQWAVRKNSVEARVERIGVLRGDTLDFVVTCGADENTDGFRWVPRVNWVEPVAPGTPSPFWDARADFAGPGMASTPLSRWEQYAQVLLMANEAVFFD